MAVNRWWVVPTLASVIAAGGCSDDGVLGPNPPPTASASRHESKAPQLTAAQKKLQACRKLVASVQATPALPGTTGLDERRGEILARAKGEPVLFRRTPKLGPNETKPVARARKLLAKSPNAGHTLVGLFRTLRYRPEQMRQLLLPEGYFYTENPSLAAMMVHLVKLGHLYRDEELWIHRGSQVLRVARSKKTRRYEYKSGPEVGRPARLMLFDRIGRASDDLGPALHFDVRRLAHQVGFDRMRLRRMTERHVLADLRYGGQWVRTVLKVDDGDRTRLSIACEVVEEADAASVAFAKDLGVRRRRVLDAQHRVIIRQVEEALPFDEPRTEEGQQDGNLRPAWIWAYNHGWDSYTFNDDPYRVFDASGRPLLPQVCIDFVTDTLERASGTWWAPRSGAPRIRTKGRLDFDALPIENRRSVQVFVDFAWQHPQYFDVVDLRPEERVPFIRRPDFYAHITSHADRYAPGDVIAIHGPRSDGEMHYHSFFVFDADPITGVPMLLAGNAGKPRIRTWEAVMRAAPRRSLRHRVRPRLEWLESIIPIKPEASSEPAPLQSAPI